MTGGGRRVGSEIRAIASLETLDGLRSRRQLVVRAATPIILFVCVAGITLALRGADAVNHPQAYRVAVEGDFAGAQATLAQLHPDRLEFFASTDARLATITDADAGLRVPDHLDEQLGAPTDETIPIEVFQITMNPASRAAAVLIEAGFTTRHADQVQARILATSEDEPAATGGTASVPTSPGSFIADRINVERTATGTRSLTSQVIPGLVCLQAALLVTGTANRMVSRRTRGLLITQLLLPISRRSLAFAKGLGEIVVGIVTASPFVVAILAFGVVATWSDSSAVDKIGHLVATALAMLLLFGFMTAVGVVIGTSARTQEQVSLATGAAVVLAALVATIFALGTFTPAPALLAVPFAGLVASLREVLNGTGSIPAFTTAMLSTGFGIMAIVAFGGRSLDAERLVIRNG